LHYVSLVNHAIIILNRFIVETASGSFSIQRES
jgi:hypothetical protein